MLKNYHTHTFRCRHATGEVSDYAKAAVKEGVGVLGISDHTPLPDNRWIKVRMGIDELEDYIQAIDTARDEFPELTILKGMECEYSKEYVSFYKDELLGRFGFDYLISGVHYIPMGNVWRFTYDGEFDRKDLRRYAEHYSEAISSGLFDFAAHPDLFGNFYKTWDQDAIACSRFILETAESVMMPLEINCYGLRKPKIETSQGLRPGYPWDKFWELASEYNITAVINSDAHRPEHVSPALEEALSLVKRYGLKIADLSHIDKKAKR